MVLSSLECIVGLILYSRSQEGVSTINNSFCNIRLEVGRSVYLDTMSCKDDQLLRNLKCQEGMLSEYSLIPHDSSTTIMKSTIFHHSLDNLKSSYLKCIRKLILH